MIEPTPDYLAAAAAAKEHDLSVCGTYRGDKPIYFLAAKEASDEQLRDAAFEAQNGRPMSEGERQILAAALERSPDSFKASLEDISA